MNPVVCSSCLEQPEPQTRSRPDDRARNTPAQRSDALALVMRRWLQALATTVHATTVRADAGWRSDAGWRGDAGWQGDVPWGGGDSAETPNGISPGCSESGVVEDSDTRPLSQPAPRSVPLILIVEDDPINRKILRRMLSRLGYDYELAENGKEALDAIQARSYDGVLMDIRMPVMDGLVATKTIRQLSDPKQAKVPIIAVTAQALEGNRETCMQMGFDDYLPKPVSRASLAASLQRVIGDAHKHP